MAVPLLSCTQTSIWDGRAVLFALMKPRRFGGRNGQVMPQDLCGQISWCSVPVFSVSLLLLAPGSLAQQFKDWVFAVLLGDVQRRLFEFILRLRCRIRSMAKQHGNCFTLAGCDGQMQRRPPTLVRCAHRGPA